MASLLNSSTSILQFSFFRSCADSYSQHGLATASVLLFRRCAGLTLMIFEVLLVFGIVALLFIPFRFYKSTKKHSATVTGAAHPDREPPRDIMASQFFQNKQGLWINHEVYWNNEDFSKPRALVVLLHGYGEHHRRFIHVAQAFVSQGFVVFSMDHQGFGRSEGDRAHVEFFSDYVDDVLDFMKNVIYNRHENYRSLPRFLVAHSMGSLVAVHVAMGCKKSSHPAHKLTGAILSSPALRINPSNQSFHMRLGASIFNFLCPKAQIVTYPAFPSTSFLQVKNHASFDPLNYHEPIRVHQGLQIVHGIEEAHKFSPSFDIPILIIHGTKDLHVGIEGSKTFFNEIISKDKSYIELPNLRHEPWQEEKETRGPILAAAVMWAVDRIDPLKKARFAKSLKSFTVDFILYTKHIPLESKENNKTKAREHF